MGIFRKADPKSFERKLILILSLVASSLLLFD